MSEYLYSTAPAIIVECLLVALLVFTPLAFGTVQTWAISVMEFACLVMVVVWLVGIATRQMPVRFRFPLGTALVLFAGLVFAQLLPHLVAGNLISTRDNPLLNIATVNFFSTKTAFVKLVCYIGLYLCLVNTIVSRRQITRVLMAVVLIGFGVSLFGLLQRLSGTQKVFWLIKVDPRKTGFMAAFIDENHFAGYIELVIPITVAFALRYMFRVGETGWRGFLGSSDVHKAFLLSFLAIVMIVSLAVSESRGGIIAFISSLFLIGVLLLCKRFHRKKAWLIAVLLTLSFAMVAWIGLSDFLKTWGTLGDFSKDRSFLRRMEVDKATWTAAMDYPAWGSGLGTFESIFPKYGTLNPRQTVPHAENDYVQTLLETGWVGLAICLLGAAIFFQTAIRTYLIRRRRSISLLAMGGAASFFAIMVHSFSDFNMRVDANLFLLVTIVAMVVGLSRIKRHRRHHEAREPSA